MASVRCILREAAEISPKEPAVINGEYVLTYNELDLMVSATAAHITRLGCVADEPIGLFMRNDWRYVVLLLAIMRMGGVATLLSTRLPAEALRDELDRAQCQKLIARVQGAGVKQLDGITLYQPDEVLVPTVSEGHYPGDLRIALDQPATIAFTSGSSTRPKAVLHSYGNHYYSARGANFNLRLHSRQRWLVSLPLYHVGGLGIVFRSLLAGATIVIPEFREDLEAAIAHYEPTHLSLVSTQLYRLLRGRKTDNLFGSVKVVLVGGGPVPDAMIREALERKIPIYTTYGLTELGSQVTTMTPISPPGKRSTTGQVLKYRELKIADDGEILVRGQTLCRGYIQDRALTPAVDDEGWFHTGDLGRVDEEGYLRVRGRKDNMFISGGENIQPEEIERALCELHGVDECLVVPIEDREFGFRPVAFIRSGQSVAQETVRNALAEVLPAFKVPVSFHDWPDEIDRIGLKVDRRFMAQLASG